MVSVTIVILASCFGDRVSCSVTGAVTNVSEIFFIILNIESGTTFVDLSEDLAKICIQNIKCNPKHPHGDVQEQFSFFK